jgi:hypothetical protein
VQVGIQTSLDSFYLFDILKSGDDPALVVVKNELDEVVLERAALFPCAKGSRDLQGARFKGGCYVLSPYVAVGSLMTGELLEAKFPLCMAVPARESYPARRTREWQIPSPHVVALQASAGSKVRNPAKRSLYLR